MKKNKLLCVESVVVAVTMLVMLTLVFVGVLSRYVLHFSISFTEEIVCAGFVLLNTMGGALASKENSHYTLDLVTGMMKPKTKKFFGFFDTLLTCIAAGTLLYCSVGMVSSQFKIGSLSPVLRVPSWWYGILVPLGLIFLLGRSIQYILHVIRTPAETLYAEVPENPEIELPKKEGDAE